MNLFVTGFGPFAGVSENPSDALARASGHPHQILEVAYEAVDEALDALRDKPSDGVLMIGVSGRATTLNPECVAHNRHGSIPDVRGTVYGPGPIDPAAPLLLHGNLWAGFPDSHGWEMSVDAGTYLCNYALFRAIQRLPNRKVGFLHVPPAHVMPIDRQVSELQDLIARLESSALA